jgi:hypothetical protein
MLRAWRAGTFAGVQIRGFTIAAMKTYSIVALLATCCTLSGCASLSENECLTADWESIGYRDGSRGYDAGRIGAHSEACAEHGIKADRQLYEEGRLRGLELYCTGENGMRLGRQGYSYSGVCPLSLEGTFMRGFQLGRELHAMDTRMQELRAEIHKVQAELKREEPPLAERDRDYLLYRLRDLEREYGRMESELRMAESRAREF